MNRRDMLLTMGALAAAPSMAKAATEEEIVDFLFVHTSLKVSLADGLLRLDEIRPHTLYFSDRPERIVGHVTTQEFVDHWGTGDDSFKDDPPNAVLTLHDDKGSIEVAVVLRNPRIEGSALLYDVDLLDGPNTVTGDWSSLFIDIIGRPLTPLSFAGAARRTSRRTARRTARRVARRN